MFNRIISPLFKSAKIFTFLAVYTFAADPAAAPKSAPKAVQQKAAASSSTATTPGATAAADTAVTEKTTVYLTSGSRYHAKGCRYLKGKGKASTIGDAMKQGLAPCNVCHAPKLKPKTAE